MKISEQWLREWVDPPVVSNDLAEQLTLAGLEVEAAEPVALQFDGVVTGRVETVAPHPRADRLRLCRVNAGKHGILEVVCGAPRITVGGNYWLALPGARLADGRELQAAQVRGVQSAGMLCSGAELGLSEDADSLFELGEGVEPGLDPAALSGGANDTVLDIAITPNRGDCLSIAGVAREVAVLNGLSMIPPAIEAAPVGCDDSRGVRLQAARACPRYAGRIIDGVDATRPTPFWIAERLRRCGLRPVSVVVDITNYVMLELGQPMHAFDDARLHGNIRVRMAAGGEKIRLLDGADYTLSEDTLVIADDGGPVAMAGIMGGADSAVSESTHRIFLESAFFTPHAVRGRARRHGLMTDASYRFERGVDFSLQGRALERATGLILDCCGGSAGPVVDAVAKRSLPKQATIRLRESRIRRVLGTGVDAERVTEILMRLGLEAERQRGGWRVRPAPHRFDLILEADLIEEVARVHGYDRIPVSHLRGGLAMQRASGDERFPVWRRILADRGYYEAITYSFVSAEAQRRLLGAVAAVDLVNPISADMDCMRVSLWPGLLQALQFNLHRQQQRVRLFEIGRAFQTGEQLEQNFHLGGVSYGNVFIEQWDKDDRLGDFFDLKTDVEAVLRILTPGLEIQWEPVRHPALQPGRTAEIRIGGQRVGVAGALNPGVAAALELPADVYLFELEIQLLPEISERKFEEISQFPSLRRDLALVVDTTVPASRVLECVRRAAGKLLVNLQLFDVYDGEGIDSGKKSLALGLTFQKTSSTLIEEEVDSALGGILERLREDLGAILRE